MHTKPIVSLGLWAGEAPIANHNSVVLLLLKFLSGPCKQRFWLWAASKRTVCKCACKGKHTYDDVFQVLAWDVRVMLSGVHPLLDFYNNPWPEGSDRLKLKGQPLRVCGAMLRKCSDWAWNKQALDLRGWRGETVLKQMCWLCNKGSFSTSATISKIQTF